MSALVLRAELCREQLLPIERPLTDEEAKRFNASEGDARLDLVYGWARETAKGEWFEGETISEDIYGWTVTA